MRKLFYHFFFILVCVGSESWAQEVIKNQSVIAMVQAKIDRELIVGKISGSACQFDLTTKGVIELKQATVPDLIISTMIQSSAPLPTVRNRDIIDLYSAKVSRDIITKMIMSSKTDFDLSPGGLIELKTAKVPDGIVKLMMNPVPTASKEASPKEGGRSTPTKKEESVANTKSTRPVDLPVPVLTDFPETGIYYEEYKAKGEYLQLDPTTTNLSKSGSVYESLLNFRTGGLSGTTQRVGLANKSANFIIEDNRRPVFYFVFGQTRKEIDDVAESTWRGVSSPNEFVLVKANVSSRGRQISIGRQSAVTSESGIRATTIPFRYKKLATGLYKVYFEEDVPAGEYVFFYNKGSEQGSSIKVYDFSLRKVKK
ncbi:hypothetical protein [Spirosoma sordidisoli]|uniref:Uncharacterized protein n=1 Tax=Spirosoma sordidisoli TaxID=2502893 RepID=A0A4Q2UL65_9BACT|nr:hypothetical protein [Spirosoma sordidisoli]RYC70054.1 hypothetical protein EQG79_09290 [Spirosoma sordidisoli]